MDYYRREQLVVLVQLAQHCPELAQVLSVLPLLRLVLAEFLVLSQPPVPAQLVHQQLFLLALLP